MFKEYRKNAALPQKADEKTEITNRQKTNQTQQTTQVVFEYRKLTHEQQTPAKDKFVLQLV